MFRHPNHRPDKPRRRSAQLLVGSVRLAPETQKDEPSRNRLTGEPGPLSFCRHSRSLAACLGGNRNWPRSPVPTANMSIVPLSSSNIFSTFAVCLEHNSHIHIFFPENSVEMSGKFPLPFQCPCEIRCDRGLAVCTRFKTRDLGLDKVAFWSRPH